jgi:hypothetical protein
VGGRFAALLEARLSQGRKGESSRKGVVRCIVAVSDVRWDRAVSLGGCCCCSCWCSAIPGSGGRSVHFSTATRGQPDGTPLHSRFSPQRNAHVECITASHKNNVVVHQDCSTRFKPWIFRPDQRSFDVAKIQPSDESCLQASMSIRRVPIFLMALDPKLTESEREREQL